MREGWDELLRQELTKEIESVSWKAHKEDQILDTIHESMKERSYIMRLSTRGKAILVAAAFVVVGSITAVAAGKVTALYSSINHKDAIGSHKELEVQAKAKMGEHIAISEELSNGSKFEEGYVTEVTGKDEAGNQVAVYPSIMAMYGDVSLDVSKGIDAGENQDIADWSENYKGFEISMSVDDYLFLPPDQEPSQEDKILEEEGKLYISYGTQEEERKTFVYASWMVGEVKYSLHTFDNKSPEELMEMAKGYIDEIEGSEK